MNWLFFIRLNIGDVVKYKNESYKITRKYEFWADIYNEYTNVGINSVHFKDLQI